MKIENNARSLKAHYRTAGSVSEGMFVLEVQPIQSTRSTNTGDSVIKARPAEVRRSEKRRETDSVVDR